MAELEGLDGASWDRFAAAVQAGDAVAVRELLAGSAPLRAAVDERRFAFDGTALLSAAWSGNQELCEVLLEAGADINRKSGWWAGGFGVLEAAPEPLARHLLARGAALDVIAAARLGLLGALRDLLSVAPALVSARGGDGKTALHVAGTVEVAALLLDAGAELEARCVDHHGTPLQYLASERPVVARYLLSRGATADVFAEALLDDAEALARRLVDDPAQANQRVGEPPFDAPEPAGGHIYGYVGGGAHATPLHAAAVAGAAGAIEALAAAGAEVNATGAYDDSTPLHLAAWHNQPAACAALLDAGAELERPSGERHRNTPAGWAVANGCVEALELLLARGAEVKPWFEASARAGLAGEHRGFSRTPPERFARILELL